MYGGVIALGSGFWVKSQIQGGIKNSDYYKLAFQQLRNHKGAIKLLGEPIRDGDLDLGKSETNHCDGLKAQFHVPVRGPQNKGIFHFWAMRESLKHPWEVTRSELELKDDSSKRLIIVKQKDS
jgi:cytochrome c oxidase assembly factor 1